MVPHQTKTIALAFIGICFCLLLVRRQLIAVTDTISEDSGRYNEDFNKMEKDTTENTRMYTYVLV